MASLNSPRGNLVLLGVLAGIFMVPLDANAGEALAKTKVQKRLLDPYEIALETVGAVGEQNLQINRSAQLRAAPVQSLQVDKRLNLNEKEIKSLVLKLEKTFGRPKSVRGANFFWEVKTPTPDPRQSKVVTIILQTDAGSGGKLILDRAAAGTARITAKRPKGKPQRPKPNDGARAAQVRPRPDHNL